MRICFDARVIIDKLTGLGNYTYNLVKHLLMLDSENEYIVLINRSLTDQHPIKHLEQKNLKKRFVQIPEVTPQQQVMVPFELWKQKPDVYHYPNFDLPVFQPYNSIFTVHDLTYLKHRDLYMNGRWIKNFYTKAIMSLAAKKSKKIISVSSSTKNDLLEILKVPEHKVDVIHEGLDESYFNGNLSNNKSNFFNKNFGLNDGDEYFLFIGERRPHKNLVRLIEAFSIFKQKTPNKIKLVIGGKKYASYDEPERKAHELNFTNEVIFLGYIPEDDLQLLYKNARCFIFISIYEGFGIPILEAMACGIPIITSNISSMPEVAGEAALTVNPYNVAEIAEAIHRITYDSNMSQRLVDTGLKRVKNFSWNNTAEKTLRLYEGILRN